MRLIVYVSEWKARSPSALALLVIAYLSLPVAVVAMKDRHKYLGEVVDGWYPCNANASNSTCCGGVNFCLSNGLCLDGGSNNFFSIQGCTGPSWNAP